MKKNETYLPYDYHMSTANSKTFFNNNSDHLLHYDSKVVKKQTDFGLDFYEHKDGFKLPTPAELDMSFSNVQRERKSSRNFNKYKISAIEISTLLHYSVGFNNSRIQRKYVPSSGGFNSVEAFPIILNSKDVDAGIYYFDSKTNSLKQVCAGKFDDWLRHHVFFQSEWSQASMIVMLASDIGRLTTKYGQRAYRLGLLDVGHVSQNLYLCSSALNLNICASAGYIESEVEQAINIDGLNISTFLTLSIGL